jgi:hypothetical protein
VTEAIGWVLAVVQVPSEPSRHRVAVWRELRRAGAVPVSQGTWALPAADAFQPALERASALATEGGGTVAVFGVRPHDDAARALIVDAFRAAREDEWREFAADCGKFTDEIAREIAKSKFTFAELEEEEQSLDRKKRDILSLPDAENAAVLLVGCERTLDAYAEQVYAAGRATSSTSSE